MFISIKEKIKGLITPKNNKNIEYIINYLEDNKQKTANELLDLSSIGKRILVMNAVLKDLESKIDPSYIIKDTKILNHHITLKNKNSSITVDLYKYPESYEIKYNFDYNIYNNDFSVICRNVGDESDPSNSTLALDFCISDGKHSDINFNYYDKKIFSYHDDDILTNELFNYIIDNIEKPEIELKENISLIYDLKFLDNSIENIIYNGLKRFHDTLNNK